MDKFLNLGPSLSIILYFQTGEGGSAKEKNFEALVFLCYHSFISYEYLVSLNLMPLFACFGTLVLI